MTVSAPPRTMRPTDPITLTRAAYHDEMERHYRSGVERGMRTAVEILNAMIAESFPQRVDQQEERTQ